MEEFTLRLPPETAETLQTEATERGVTLGEHIRDIIDAHRGRDSRRTRCTYEVDYDHTTTRSRVETAGSEPETSRTEEIGSFSYGSKSILSLY